MSSADGQRESESHSFRFFDLFNNHKNEQENFETTSRALRENVLHVFPILMRSRWLIKATANGPNISQLFTTHKTDSEKVPETHLAK